MSSNLSLRPQAEASPTTRTLRLEENSERTSTNKTHNSCNSSTYLAANPSQVSAVCQGLSQKGLTLFAFSTLSCNCSHLDLT